ncbi:hypothetical protein TNCV_1052571 [Trichonephila clavipes]|nr:hypothetical protein TNCV_1052571 [Trichonephila clavipes]
MYALISLDWGGSGIEYSLEKRVPVEKEVGKPIDENSACVEVGTTSQTPAKRCQLQNYFPSNDIICEEDFIRVVEKLDGTVETTDTIVKLKTKIENSSTFESDPDFVKTLIQNCIDERYQNEKRSTRCGQRTVRISRCGMQPKATQSPRLGALNETKTKTFELVEEKQKNSWTLSQRKGEHERCASERLPSEYHRQTYL